MNLNTEQLGFSTSTIFKLEDAISYAEGAIVSKIISKKETGNVTLFAFDKDQFLSEHTAPFDAIIQVSEGNAIVSINSQEYILNVGQMIIMPANIPHAVYAKTCMKMMLIMIRSN